MWLEKVGSIIGGFSSDNGNGSKNVCFFKVCRDYVNLFKVLVAFAVDVRVAKLSSQVCQYSGLRLVLFGFVSCTVPWVSLSPAFVFPRI